MKEIKENLKYKILIDNLDKLNKILLLDEINEIYESAARNYIRAIAVGIREILKENKKTLSISDKKISNLGYSFIICQSENHLENESMYTIEQLLAFLKNIIDFFNEHTNNEMHLNYVNSISDKKIQNWNLEEKEWKNNFYIFVNGHIYDDSIGMHRYEISEYNYKKMKKHPSEKKNKWYVYSEDIFLSIGNSYIISASFYVNKNIDGSLKILKIKSALPILAKNNKVVKNEYLKYLNMAIKYGYNPMDFTILVCEETSIIQNSEKYKEVFRKLLNNIINNNTKNLSEVYKFITLLRNPHPSKFKDILLNANDSPLLYEFWTKNPHGKRILFRDKIFISEFLVKNFSIPKSYFSFKENEIFNIQLYKENEISLKKYGDIKEYFPDNKKLLLKNNEEFKEKAVHEIEYGDYIKWTKRSYEIIINKYKKDEVANKKIDLREFSFSLPFEFLETKKEEILSIFTNSFTVINGPAGSGKTTIASTIIFNLIKNNEDFIFLSPTHKAKEVLSNLCNKIKIKEDDIKSMTVKSFVDNYERNFLDDKKENLIIDEISMVNISDWNALSEIIKEYKRVIMIGDPNQLPPVEPGPIHKIFFDTKYKLNINRITLKETFRQKDENIKNTIVSKVLRREKIIGNEDKILTFANLEDYNIILNKISQKISSDKNKNKYKILSPTRKGIYGISYLNSYFSKSDLENSYSIGDEVIVDIDPNYYKLKVYAYKNKLLKITEKISETIYKTDVKTRLINTHYEDEIFWFTDFEGWLNFKMDFDNESPVALSFATTIHCSQGSEIDTPIILIPPKYKMDYSFLYTAVSRSVNNIIFIIHKLDYHKYFDISKSEKNKLVNSKR